jgi:hypothetical protein
MSVSRAWFGSDTFGRSVEVAERSDGQFFCRFYEYNGYGKSWSKWERYDNATFETHGENRYTGERTEYTTPVLFWGFNPMKVYSNVPRFRLPKAASH